MKSKRKIERARLVAWHLIEASVEKGFNSDDFEMAVFSLLWWICADKNDKARQALLTLTKYKIEHELPFQFKNWPKRRTDEN